MTHAHIPTLPPLRPMGKHRRFTAVDAPPRVRCTATNGYCADNVCCPRHQPGNYALLSARHAAPARSIR